MSSTVFILLSAPVMPWAAERMLPYFRDLYPLSSGTLPDSSNSTNIFNYNDTININVITNDIDANMLVQ